MVVRVAGVDLKISKARFAYKCCVLCFVMTALTYQGAKTAYHYDQVHFHHTVTFQPAP